MSSSEVAQRNDVGPEVVIGGQQQQKGEDGTTSSNTTKASASQDQSGLLSITTPLHTKLPRELRLIIYDILVDDFLDQIALTRGEPFNYLDGLPPGIWTRTCTTIFQPDLVGLPTALEAASYAYSQLLIIARWAVQIPVLFTQTPDIFNLGLPIKDHIRALDVFMEADKNATMPTDEWHVSRVAQAWEDDEIAAIRADYVRYLSMLHGVAHPRGFRLRVGVAIAYPRTIELRSSILDLVEAIAPVLFELQEKGFNVTLLESFTYKGAKCPFEGTLVGSREVFDGLVREAREHCPEYLAGHADQPKAWLQ
ncbi:hypothetical protein BU24DRAFT_414976 [Aaosphaeria arxii CBS 175.79]|uniref:Uncharacterized protein n=1 Tax=Aaosphaeria arxii CBS 175.79 TaxID=1450172 RepID=A0A6A5X9T0_9PLEO|nr:uncharacterized protein BU24DRAFT_414976 [Aaosphaeria arxii CBS 175.79]KAF2009670.1 hypothetical protein BU24DRAFT_414976 [Aaosphaeria arxii CBS 175.79]